MSGTVSAYLYGIARKLVLRWIERGRGFESEDAVEAVVGEPVTPYLKMKPAATCHRRECIRVRTSASQPQ